MSGAKKSGKAEPAADKSYAVGDIVLAKVKGFPSWPGQIVEHDMAPPEVKRQKPPKSKSIHLVRFFPTGDYAWTISRDISALSAREIEAYVASPHKKSGDLLEGYRIAADPTEWQREKDEEQSRWEEAQELLAAVDTEDQLASGGEEAAGKEKPGKKRKRKSEAGPAVGGAEKKESSEEKKAKKPKVEKPEKLAKSRTAGGKKSAVQSEDDAPPAAKKSKPAAEALEEDPGLKQVKDWRHKLQRAFLGKDGPLISEIPKCKEHFDAMDKFEMKSEWLAESKLGKVVKRISIMVDPPLEEEFGFKGRATTLLNLWSDTGKANSTPAVATPNPSQPPPEVEMADAAPAEVKTDAPVEESNAEVSNVASTPMEVDEAKPNGVNGSSSVAEKVDELPAAVADAPTTTDSAPIPPVA